MATTLDSSPMKHTLEDLGDSITAGDLKIRIDEMLRIKVKITFGK